jgi:hypothetical protein
MKVIKRIVVAVAFLAILLSSGCGVFGLLGTPTQHEKKVPAEYDLAAQSDKKLLVLVNQPAWLGTSADMERRLTEAIHKHIDAKLNKKKKKISLIPYEQIAGFNSQQSEHYVPSPAQTGRQLNADLVLYVVINEYQLTQIPRSSYYKGQLAGVAQLTDVQTGKVLWPDSMDGKSITVAFDVEQGGYEAAVARLANSFAYCTVRYFYDCPLDEFKIFDDKSHTSWQQWED